VLAGAVINAGRIVEEGPADDVLTRPTDDYTRRARRRGAVPDPDARMADD